MPLEQKDMEFILAQDKEVREELKKELRLVAKDIATNVSARVDDKLDQKMGNIETKIDLIIDHNKKQNGWIEKNQNEIIELQKNDIKIEEYQKNCSSSKLFKRLSKPRTWFAGLIFLMGLIFLGVWLYNRIDWVSTIENRTGVKIIDHGTDTVIRE